jgi:hypothetical protein
MAQIACLGWGSLVWEPRELPKRSPWYEDGPFVAVDFLRQSDNGCVTLVLDGSAQPVPSRWTWLAATELAQAREDLRIRERMGPKGAARFIGVWTRGDSSPALIEPLDAWAQARDIDHVIWTALPAKFDGVERTPSADEIVGYLRDLAPGAIRNEAERYIRRAPREVDTPLRRRIAAELRWTPSEE